MCERLAEWKLGEIAPNELGFSALNDEWCQVHTQDWQETPCIYLFFGMGVPLDRELARKLAGVLETFADTGELKEPSHD